MSQDKNGHCINNWLMINSLIIHRKTAKKDTMHTYRTILLKIISFPCVFEGMYFIIHLRSQALYIVLHLTLWLCDVWFSNNETYNPCERCQNDRKSHVAMSESGFHCTTKNVKCSSLHNSECVYVCTHGCVRAGAHAYVMSVSVFFYGYFDKLS